MKNQDTANIYQGKINNLLTCLAPNTIMVSPVSIWEIVVLAQKKKIELPQEPDKFAKEIIVTIGTKEAPLTSQIALLSRELKFNHEDPADRFLAATAYNYEIPLVTSDDKLRGLSWLRTVSAG